VLLAIVNSFDQTFYTADNLVTGTLYKFQVTAVNGIGESLLSAEVSAYAKSLPGMPQTPYLISSTKTVNPDATLVIGWQALTDAGGVTLTGYKLYQTVVATSTTTLVHDGTDDPSTLQKTLTGLTLDAEYEFYVTGLNPDEGPASDILLLRAAAVPSQPGAITEVAGTRTGSSIGLQWVAPSDDGGSAITAYTLVVTSDNEDDEVIYYGTSLQGIVSNLTAGEEYTFKVKATNLVGDGPWSSMYKFLIVDAPTPPLNPQVDSYSNTQVTLSWEQPLYNGGEALSGFKIYMKDCSDSTASFSLLATKVASQFSHTDSTVTGGKCYLYYILAYNA